MSSRRLDSGSWPGPGSMSVASDRGPGRTVGEVATDLEQRHFSGPPRSMHQPSPAISTRRIPTGTKPGSSIDLEEARAKLRKAIVVAEARAIADTQAEAANALERKIAEMREGASSALALEDPEAIEAYTEKII